MARTTRAATPPAPSSRTTRSASPQHERLRRDRAKATAMLQAVAAERQAVAEERRKVAAETETLRAITLAHQKGVAAPTETALALAPPPTRSE